MTAPTNDAVQAARDDAADFVRQAVAYPDHSTGRITIGTVRAILSALTVAEERAATLERERDEAVRRAGDLARVLRGRAVNMVEGVYISEDLRRAALVASARDAEGGAR